MLIGAHASLSLAEEARTLFNHILSRSERLLVGKANHRCQRMVVHLHNFLAGELEEFYWLQPTLASSEDLKKELSPLAIEVVH